MLRNVAQCHAMSRNVAQCRAMLRNVAQCRAMSRNVAQCRAMSRNRKITTWISSYLVATRSDTKICHFAIAQIQILRVNICSTG
jgi:hypothetical protein